ncbi:MAG: AAA family ATPase, partial [Gemmatimonadota bacterium]
MNTLRIFISSPGDVAEERERARQVVQGLRRRSARHVDLVPVLWEDMPLGLDASFQEGIDLLLSKDRGVDVAVFILWSRLGSALGARFTRSDGREYRSGTERELDLMLQARAAQGGKRPHILAYARQDEATFEEGLRGKSTAEKEKLLQQKKLVESFIQEEFHDEQTGTNLRAYHTYHRPQSFSERLRVHLQEILDGSTEGQAGKPAWDIDHRGPPFLGLESFKYEHAEVFFGREDEVSEALLRLANAAKRGTAFLLVSGGSGTGKSSLAAAGIVPEIVAHETDESVSRWLHASFTPAALGGDPAVGMARILAQAVSALAARGEGDAFADGLRQGPAVAAKLAILPALKAEATKSGGARLVLLVDQLEELFTDTRLTDESRDQFAGILEALATSGQVWVVATIRGDFYHRLLGCPGLVQLKQQGAQLDLVPPGADALRRMIESPALLSGLSYEKVGETTLADRILRDVSGQAELLPLLEDLLRELFERRSADGVLTVAAYESLGGIEGSLAKRSEASLTSLPSDVQLAFPDVLRRLVATGDGPEGTAVRRRVALESFAPGSSARALVDRLIADRLATASAGDDGTPEVSIAHEAILRVWPRATSWIRENTEFLRLRDRLAARMREGAPLSAADPLVPAARAILGSKREAFEPEIADYVEAQLAAIDADRKRRVRSRRIAIGAVAATVVAVALGGLAMQARAERQRRDTRAEGAVEALLQAGSADIATAARAVADPGLATAVVTRLREAFATADSQKRKVRAAIGLASLPEAGEDVWESLGTSQLEAEPVEVAVIREALRPRADQVRGMLWE